MSTGVRAARPAAACPIRPGEPCTLCQVGAFGTRPRPAREPAGD
ncbi:DUF6767 domain-containing protein [Micromonospora sp. NPDC005806]